MEGDSQVPEIKVSDVSLVVEPLKPGYRHITFEFSAYCDADIAWDIEQAVKRLFEKYGVQVASSMVKPRKDG